MASKLTELNLAPCGDYVSHALNSFLLELNDDLTDEDLRKLIFLCEGKYGLKKARREQIKCSLDLFDFLREKELLNEMNIISLQSMLWLLPRRDLQKKYVEFAESIKSSIHFVVPRETPENGYKHLKFHIEGADLNKYGRQDLEKLRSEVALLLFVPPEFVIVSGIEPSSSLMITIMLLEDDAQRLASTSPEAIAVLSYMFVDYIKVGTTNIPVSATTKPAIDHPPAESRLEKEAREALLRQNRTERELDRAHEKISKLQSDLTTAKSDSQSTARLFYLLVVVMQQLDEFCTSLLKIKKVIEDQAFNPIDKLEKLCVFANFKHCLGKVRELGYKEDIIYNLLDAQALVFQSHNHERKDIEIANLRMELAFTTWEKDKLAFYHNLGVQDKIMSRREEFCVSAIAQNLPVAIKHNVIINTSISDECVEYVLRRLSQDVMEPEVILLTKKQRIKGPPANAAYDHLNKTFQQRRSQSTHGVELRAFVRDVLATPLKRMDLLQNVDRYVFEFRTANENPQPSKMSNKKSGKRKSRAKFPVHRGKSFSAKKDSGSVSTPEQQMESLQEIIKMLGNIEKRLPEKEDKTYGKLNKNSMLDSFESLLKSKKLLSRSIIRG